LLARNDRIFYTFNEFYDFSPNEILSIMEQECRNFEKILDSVNPDYVILWHPTLRQDYLLYLICKAKGIKTLIQRPTRIGSKSIINDNYKTIGFEKINSQETLPTSSKNLLDFHIKNDPQKDWKRYRNRFMSSKKHMFGALIKYFFSENTNPNTHYTYFGRSKLKVLQKYIKYLFQAKTRKIFIDKNFHKQIDLTKPFIYFPLHIELERSTLIHAPFSTDQLHVIKQIVKSLPIGIQLYIKEHPNMKSREWRPISLYKEIMKLPNVSLLHPSIDPNILLKNCSLVIAITGTAAFDAGFFKKPAITFVETDFSSLNHVTVVDKISELPNLIKNCLNKTIEYDDIGKYVDYIEKNGFNIDTNSLQQNVQDALNYGGFLVDVEINETEFNSLLNSNKNEFDLMAIEHIKKFS